MGRWRCDKTLPSLAVLPSTHTRFEVPPLSWRLSILV
jgi:hypothetical protein